MMLITVIAFCENFEQMNDNIDQSLIIGVLSKLLPFLVNDKGEKSYGDREKLTDTKVQMARNSSRLLLWTFKYNQFLIVTMGS